jgi:hypothetical protein
VIGAVFVAQREGQACRDSKDVDVESVNLAAVFGSRVCAARLIDGGVSSALRGYNSV